MFIFKNRDRSPQGIKLSLNSALEAALPKEPCPLPGHWVVPLPCTERRSPCWSEWPRANRPVSRPQQGPLPAGCAGGWEEAAVPEDTPARARGAEASRCLPSKAAWIPTAASCQRHWQTNLWKSKYVYHADFLCPFLNKEGLYCFPESDLYHAEAVSSINMCSHAHSNDYSHRWYGVVWF